MAEMSQKYFEGLDFGTTITTSSYDTISVTLDPNVMIRDYGQAVAKDLQRRNPERYNAISSQLGDGQSVESLLADYMEGLVILRVQMIKDKCVVYRQAKRLAIPPYVQFAISQIGEARDIDHGRVIVPELSGDVDIDKMLGTSKLLECFTADGVVLLFDAFPRTKEGDLETMTFALIDNYVKGIDRTHPAKSYISVFLGMKLKEETTWKALYSVRYDNKDFVKSMLMDELTKW